MVYRVPSFLSVVINILLEERRGIDRINESEELLSANSGMKIPMVIICVMSASMGKGCLFAAIPVGILKLQVYL